MAITDDFLAFVPRLRSWASSRKQIRRAWIIGSRLRGTQRDDSDLDLVLEIDPLETKEAVQLAWMDEKAIWHQELQSLTPHRISLDWYGGEATPSISQYVACCSMLVFERAI